MTIKINDVVTCNVGANKGKRFKIEAVLKNGMFSCSKANEEDNKYYQYSANMLTK